MIVFDVPSVNKLSGGPSEIATARLESGLVHNRPRRINRKEDSQIVRACSLATLYSSCFRSRIAWMASRVSCRATNIPVGACQVINKPVLVFDMGFAVA